MNFSFSDGGMSSYGSGVSTSTAVQPYLPYNYNCSRQELMGEIVRYTSPYLFPFAVEYSFVAAAVLIAMWRNIGKNPRYWGEEDDHISVASRKMTNYAKTDCVGASKGLFFGLITLICGLICLVLFFVLIHHENVQVRRRSIQSLCDTVLYNRLFYFFHQMISHSFF